MASNKSVMLPKNVRPSKYRVDLVPSFEDFTFKGTVSIDLEVLEKSSQLKLHASELTILKAEVRSKDSTFTFGGDESDAGSFALDKEEQTLTLTLRATSLDKGPAVLKIVYTGVHNDNMVGFYKSTYTKDGTKQYMVATQFEAIDARKCLPCWDEPALKATFSVSLAAPPGMIALSNMQALEEHKNEDGSTVFKYTETPIMSTYLLACVVGSLDYISTTTEGGTEVRVYTTPGRKEEGQFALKVASQILTFFTKYFGIAYPLPKCDLVAIPDFASGAMENWGLVTFRETALLVDEANASAASRQRVAYVVSHELAHQWFGNLVTMQWWDDLWLNEGFATWVGWLGVDHCFPEWDVWTQFVSSEVSVALSTDALLGSHPIEVPIEDPKEIQQVFDALSYRKGAAVIRQLESAVGAENFKKGLNSYLESHKYGNTVTTDLWRALAAASGKPVHEMMSSWTKQMGFPLISVEALPGGGLQLRQSRFLSSGPPTPEQDTILWWVPITAIASADGKSAPKELKQSVLSTKEATFPDLRTSPGGWLKLNVGQSGIYRVNYTEAMWQGLAQAVSSLALPPVDRLGILSDAFALAKAGLLPTSLALELSMAFVNETDYTVWSELSSNIAELDTIFSSSEHYPLFTAVVRRLFKKIADTLGWEAKPGESHLTSLLRPLVLQMLAKFGDEATIAECQKRFPGLAEDLSSVHPDLRQLVMSFAVKHGGRSEYEKVLSIFRTAPSQDLKIRCMQAVGYTQDPNLVKEYLAFGFDEEEVKAQDCLYVVAGLASNPRARDISWNYVKKNWGDIYGRYAKRHMLISYMACLPLRGFSTHEKAVEAEEFFEANPTPESRMEISRSVESIHTRASWLERSEAEVGAWLKAQA